MQKVKEYGQSLAPVNGTVPGGTAMCGHPHPRATHTCTVRTAHGPVRVSGNFSEVMNVVRAALTEKRAKEAAAC